MQKLGLFGGLGIPQGHRQHSYLTDLVEIFGMITLNSLGYHMALFARFYVWPFWYNTHTKRHDDGIYHASIVARKKVTKPKTSIEL